MYYINPDGWVNKCKEKGHNSFEGQFIKYPDNLIPDISALICVGWISDKYSVDFYIYKITKVKKSFLGMGLPTIYGEEYGYERL